MPDFFSATGDDGITVSSNTESQADLDALVKEPPAADDSDGAAIAPVAEGEPPAAAVERDEQGKFVKAAKPRDDPRARVEAATAKEATAKRERDEARTEAARLRSELDATRRPAPREESARTEQPIAQKAWARFKAMPDAPKLSEFEGADAFEDYSLALAAFVSEKSYTERRQAEYQQDQQQRVFEAEQTHYREFQGKLRAAQTADPDFLSKIDTRLTETHRLSALPEGARPTFGNYLVEQIYRSETPAELLVHFTAHPEDVQRLAALPPDRIVREIARLEARLAPTAATPETGTALARPISKAKPPITPVKGSSQSTSDDSSDDEPVENYIRRENAREFKSRRAS